MSLNALSAPERLKSARDRASRLVDHVSALFLMRESNRLVVSSPTLAKQIPRSFAANAFNQFQISMHLFEIVRLCALWDSYRDDRESIPAIVALIDKPEIIDLASNEVHSYYLSLACPRDLTSTDDPIAEEIKRDWWDRERVARASDEAQSVREQLSQAIEKSNAIRASDDVRALREFRHTHIAHNLDLGTIDQETEVHRLKHGDESNLLDKTVS